jgi:hypothetical protein
MDGAGFSTFRYSSTQYFGGYYQLCIMELGQPLHAFDGGQVQGSVHVRQASANEKLVLLNEQEIELTEDVHGDCR